MRLEGIHHVTAITSDARRNLDFYARVLGLRFVKKTVNFDAPDTYHVYYGDELGRPGSIITFFEWPGVPRGRAGAGMVHRISWRVEGEQALAFWAERLAAEDVETARETSSLRFVDPDGLVLELIASEETEEALVADAPDVPAEHALQGFAGVRAYATAPEASRTLLTQSLAFEDEGGSVYRAAGGRRSSLYAYDGAPSVGPQLGAGTVHHIAWASRDEHHEAWLERVRRTGARPTDIIDRTYFRSIYFREPSGVLFELATLGPGFTVDEPAEELGRSLQLPAFAESLRPTLERSLAPLKNPRDPVPSGTRSE